MGNPAEKKHQRKTKRYQSMGKQLEPSDQKPHYPGGGPITAERGGEGEVVRTDKREEKSTLSNNTLRARVRGESISLRKRGVVSSG